MANANDSVNSPEFGKIYHLRESVRKTFQSLLNISASDLPASSSSASSSSSSNKSRNKQSNRRPCLCWDITNESVTVLLMTSFEGINSMAKKSNGEWMISNISHEDLLKYLVSIYPTPPIPGRQTIKITRQPSMGKLTDHEDNSFLILIPITVKPTTKWSRLFDGVFSADHLRYIGELLTELDKDKKEQMILNFSHGKNDESGSTDSTIPQTRTFNINTIENDQILSDDSGSDSSEGSGSLFVCRTNMVKKDKVLDWLHQCASCNLNDSLIESMSTMDAVPFLSRSSDVMDRDTRPIE